MSVVTTIMRREIDARLATRAFRIVTGIMILFAFFVPLIALAGSGNDTPARDITIGLVGNMGGTVETELRGATSDDVRVAVVRFARVEAAQQSLIDDNLDALLVADGSAQQVIYDRGVDDEIGRIIDRALLSSELRAAGLSQEADTLLAASTPEEVVFVEDGEDNAGSRVAFFALFATFFSIQTYGALLTMSVIEEKATRVVEVLLAHVRPYQLLAGKILGVSIVSIGQLLVPVTIIVAMLLLTGQLALNSTEIAILPVLLLTYILGFLLYAVLCAAAGSLLSRQEDAQQVLMPLMLPLWITYLVSIALISVPNAMAARVLAIIPLTSPLVLPVRLAVGDVSAVFTMASLAVLAVSIALAIRVAGRMYSYALLRTGTRVRMRTAARAQAR